MRKKRRKLNIGKVLIVLLLIVLMIIGIYFLVKDNEDNVDDTQMANQPEEQDVVLEEKNVESVVEAFGGTITEKAKNDTCFVTKDGAEYTVYSDGTSISGRIVPCVALR